MKNTDPSAYDIFYIKKPNGSDRLIQAPKPELKALQTSYLPFFNQVKLFPGCASGPHGSTLQAASPHYYSKRILRIDIKDCFSSVTKGKIIYGLAHLAINNVIPIDTWLKEFEVKLDDCLIENSKGELVLPTGAPTSPILCNIALSVIDEKYKDYQLGMSHYIYTRYMDDIHISSKIDQDLSFGFKDVCKQIQAYGYKINWLKSGQYAINTQTKVIVTGIRLGTKNKLPRDFRRIVRAKLENLARENKPLDAEAIGMLSYTQQIEPEEYTKSLAYYQKRINRAQCRS